MPENNNELMFPCTQFKIKILLTVTCSLQTDNSWITNVVTTIEEYRYDTHEQVRYFFIYIKTFLFYTSVNFHTFTYQAFFQSF